MIIFSIMPTFTLLHLDVLPLVSRSLVSEGEKIDLIFDLIHTDCMSSEACVRWSVGPMAGWVCKAEAFNRKLHHLILVICKDNARSTL